ncbi:MAG TPA: hypothetical protein VF666_17205 [Pyrinomonadaceae bacterium]|jgi:hypothetical protein
MRKRFVLLLKLLLALLVAAVLVWFAVREFWRGSLVVDATVNANSHSPEQSEIFFYVLDEDLIKLAMGRGEAASPTRERVLREHPLLPQLAGLMNARRREAYSLSPDVFLLLEQSRPLWESHIVEMMQTRAQEGKVSFEDFAPGTYWLMAYATTRHGGGQAFWNLQVKVVRGETRVSLDERNALYFRRSE